MMAVQPVIVSNEVDRIAQYVRKGGGREEGRKKEKGRVRWIVRCPFQFFSILLCCVLELISTSSL